MVRFTILAFSILGIGGININTEVTPSQQHINYWDSGKVYTYTALFLDSLGDTLTDEIITITPTGKPWDIAPKQTLLSIHLDFSAEDSAKLAPYPANGKKLPWFRDYKEGAIQDSTRVWMHPVRANQYIITEMAPFPEVRFPLENKTWSSGLTIYESFGSFAGHIDKTYTMGGHKQHATVFGKLNCWIINATATHNKLGTSTLTTYFNTSYGFVEMHYTFYNGKQLVMKLIDFKK